MVKVSVSVPVYNVKSYLKQCVDSLLSQTLQDIEIILVDDGSTDGSEIICDDYARQDSRVRVFHKTNGGLASARRVGLDNAKGIYYIVCDSDDYVEPNMLEKLYSVAVRDNADMVICDFFLNYPNGTQKKVSHKYNSFDQKQLIGDAICQKITGSGCNKLVRTEVYHKYGISYEEGINLGEDLLIFLKLLLHPLVISYLPQAFYHYRRDRNSDSYTNHPTKLSFNQLYYINEWKRSHFNKEIYGREMFISTMNLAFTALRVPDFPKEQYKVLCKEQLPIKLFLKYHPIGLKSLLILFSTFSFCGSRMLMRQLYKFFYR
jgi:glycosyltransferase involved in cell wall biosynthesis